MLWRCRIPVFLHATSRQRFLAFKSVSMIPTPWTGIYLSEIGVPKGERQEAITGTRCYVRPLLSGYSDPVDINHLEQLYLFAKKQSAADEHLRTSLSRCAAHAAPEAQTSKLSRRTQSLTRYRTRSLSAEKIRTHPILFPARRDSSPFSVPSSRLCTGNPSTMSHSRDLYRRETTYVTTLVKYRTTGRNASLRPVLMIVLGFGDGSTWIGRTNASPPIRNQVDRPFTPPRDLHLDATSLGVHALPFDNTAEHPQRT